MQLAKLAAWLDTGFALERHAEPRGWDFAIHAADREVLLANASPMFKATFNGLLLAQWPVHDVDRCYLMVFPEASLIERVVEWEKKRGAPGAMILTHHPCDMETSGRGFLAIPATQIDTLKSVNVAIYVLHAPLDCNEAISTSGALAAALGLRVERRFAPYVGGDCGVIACGPRRSFAAFAESVRETCELPWFRPDQVRFGGREVERVAIVAGGGDDAAYIREAEALGADTYLAGHWWTPHAGEWCDTNRVAVAEAIGQSAMNFLSASHDGSELVVFRDALAPMITDQGIEAVLLRQADHWR